VNPLSALSWSWRALRGHSITFAALFGCSALGLSLLSVFRGWLSRSGAAWYVCLIAPAFLAFRGHLQVLVRVSDRLDDRAFLGLARHDYRPAVAAVHPGLARIKHQAALHLVGVAAVALVAVFDEERADFGLEELEVGCGELGAESSVSGTRSLA